LIVPNDTLWITKYDIKNLLCSEPEKVEECNLFLDVEFLASNFTYTISHLHIYTLNGFDNFLNKLKNDDIYWNDKLFSSVNFWNSNNKL